MAANYKGGFFTVASGTVAVTGLGFRPQVILFFGSNKTTEDSVIVGGLGACMRGAMVKDDVTGNIISWGSSVVPHRAWRFETKPIVCNLNAGTGSAYQADAVSMDADGFTVNFTIAAVAAKIHYLAIGGMPASYARNLTFGTSATVNVGFEAWSGLHIGGLDDSSQDACGTGRECATYGHIWTTGGKSFDHTYIGTGDGPSMHLQAADTPFNDQDDLSLFTELNGFRIGGEQHFTGPFMTPGYNSMTRSGNNVSMAMGPANAGHFCALTEESAVGRVTSLSGSVDGSTNILSDNTKVEVPAAILFLGACGRESTNNAHPSAISLGFWTPDYSYCVASNGLDNSFFQSRQYAWCSKVTTAGAHAGTAASNAPSAIGANLVTELAGVTPANMIWHMFGPPIESPQWIPQMYRWPRR